MKTVYQTDHLGFFVAAVQADPSPLEPGVFLIPAGAYEVPPPVFNQETHKAQWVGSSWVLVVKEEEQETPVEETPLTPEEALNVWRQTAEVSRFQARVALYNFGLFDVVDGALNGPDAPFLAKEAWASASVFRRMSPTILAFKPLLGLTDEQLDELFRAAQNIQA